MLNILLWRRWMLYNYYGIGKEGQKNNMIDVLIPLGKGSRHDNLELKYCLRSIEKHLTGIKNVWIVGQKPGWIDYNLVVHVPYQDNPNNWMRANNIYNKILNGCNSL